MRKALLVTSLSLVGTALLASALMCLTSGCSSLGYYAQAVRGHVDIVQRAKPVAQWLADETTPALLRERLQLSQRIRDYAVSELHLPDNSSYRSYADVQRSAVVWNVVAAPELSLQLKTWCFAVMGCVGYRGYFSRADAQTLASELQAQGWEVSVYGVPAYSTLGWTQWLGGDPLLNTFMNWPEGELARLIFHELAHLVAYASDDTLFNESFATAVERIGGRRWLATQASAAARAEFADREVRRADFRELTMRHRQRLQTLYASLGTDTDKRAGKAALKTQLDADIAALKTTRWAGFTGYDPWFAKANNAAFGLQAAYNELVPAFERVFDQQGGNFPRFYAEVKRLAALPMDERRAALANSR